MIRLAYLEAKALIVSKGYQFYENDKHPFNLNIIGFRNRFGRVDYFDDTISVYYNTDTGEIAERHYAATTMPGLPYLRKPMNVKGTAILVPGQYVATYRLGLHKGYDALVQAKDVSVYRDSDRDSKYTLEDRSIEKGMFGINIHRAGIRDILIGVNSAGCQVLRYRQDFQDLLTLCMRAQTFWGNKFTYTLVEI